MTTAGASSVEAPRDRSAPRPRETPLIVVVGNPNTGKTTLFNRLTGQNARIGNYPGVTVERRSGFLTLAEGRRVEVVDVPGTYSLAARSAEEQIALSAILVLSGCEKPDLCVAVLDAGNLSRNLYLLLQLAELDVPLVVALNMMDEVADNPPDPAALSRLFGVPCVPTNARTGAGQRELEAAIDLALREPPRSTVEIAYPEPLREDVSAVIETLPVELRTSERRARALALWALSSIEEDDELEGIDPTLRARCLERRQSAAERDLDLEVAAARYAFVDRNIQRLYRRVDSHPPKRKSSERVDRVLLHPVFGFAIFITLMLIVFQTLFSWSDPLIGLVEDSVAWLQGLAGDVLPEGVLRDLVVEGVIGGVGNVVVFLPQIVLLFLFIGLLEDSGYMARVAYLMDRIMKSLGLHGRAFVPMLSGFACAVPAIMATRTMERQRDRLLTMLVIPLMTCSARLPVYTLIIAALFPPSQLFGWLPVQGLLMVAMYLFSVTITLLAAAVLGRTAVKGRRIPLILELPPYRWPGVRATLKLIWDRASVFLKEAGTVILACTIALWFLLSFPRVETNPVEPVDGKAAPTQLEQSYAGRLGKAIEPALEPLGFDWKIGVGLIGAFAAREVFVSTMGLVYGIGEVDEEAAPLRERIKSEVGVTGKPVYTPLVGLSLMVFFALSCQCMSTLAVVKRETKSWRWPAFMFAYMTVLAYAASLLVYQGGRLLGL